MIKLLAQQSKLIIPKINPVFNCNKKTFKSASNGFQKLQKNFSTQVEEFDDPLEIDIPDRTARHYGKLTDVKVKMHHLSQEQSRLQHYVTAYRKYGHYNANIDPLNQISRLDEFLNPLDYGLNYSTPVKENLNPENSHLSETAKDLEDLENKLKQIYTGSVGIEFSHINSKAEKNWLYKNYEKYQSAELSAAEKRNIHTLLVQTEAVDHYLHKKFSSFKRYAGEGVESTITGLKTLLAKASEMDVKECVIGMPHRGRLNVLLNILDYPADHLFRKIKGFCDMPEEFYNANDDVISHIAVSKTKTFVGTGCKEKPISVSLMHNPSHLELINPSSLGKVRAKQDEYRDKSKVLNVQFHGDAAVSAQGVVYEQFAISQVPKFSIGGTVHIIVNNQIGYTTSIKDSRGHFYCSDIGKMYEIPIMHVNSDDPEAIHRVMKFAVDYRQTFQKDIIIDLIGYRKYGHNELDEPEFTQPLYYKYIRGLQESLPTLYHKKLTEGGIVKSDLMENLREKVFGHMEKIYKNTKLENGRPLDEYKSEKGAGQTAFTKKWRDFDFSTQFDPSEEVATGLNAKYLSNIAKQSVTIPHDFNIHPRLKKFFIDDRIKQIEDNKIDWATAEAAAIGSLLDQSYNVRLSGEDVERGTFSQRHWVLVDQENEMEWNPLKEMSESMNKGNLYACNSPLSESAVLSYEYGYSLESPYNLTLWEAQFGDFFNCAQSTFDTLLFASEEKWARQTGLVTILPHGFDGAGPEHSSCKIERFLQLGSTDGVNRHFEYKEYQKGRKATGVEDQVFYQNSSDTNFSFVQPTTPANYFHVLRRQMLRKFRKPLVVAGPKTLLRSKACRSSFQEMQEGTKFLPVLERSSCKPDSKVVILCSGKVSYSLIDLLKEKSYEDNVSLLVLEELLPFPETILSEFISNINKNNNTKFVWVQEEQTNSGAYTFVEPHMNRILKKLGFEDNELYYIGRKALAVPAIGVPSLHKKQQLNLMEQTDKYIAKNL